MATHDSQSGTRLEKYFHLLARTISHRVSNFEEREQSWVSLTDRTSSKAVSHALLSLEVARELVRMTPDDPETVRGDCSFWCGETVTGRHAIIHYETAGGDPCVWAECPSCGEMWPHQCSLNSSPGGNPRL